MPTLPDNPDLGWLKKRAKRLRRRFAAGDAEAIALVTTYDPSPGSPASTLTLSGAQRVLARSYGFASWPRLRAHLATIEAYARWPEPADPAEAGPHQLLRLACLSYTGYDPAALRRAEQLVDAGAADGGALADDPWTLAALGRADALAALLRVEPALARTEGGPFRWPPLLYLCYARLGAQRGDPVATATVLIAAGADPDAGYLWQGLTSPFTALTGAFGGGERGEPPHPDAIGLARVLLDAGADPNDNQTLYDRMFTPEDDHLELLLAYGLGTERPSPWRDRLGTAYPSPAEMVGEQLRSAAEYGYLHRVELLLAHGVDPNTTGYHPILGDQTAYEVAVRTGHLAAAALLEAAGGRSDRLDEVDRLVAALLDGSAVDASPALLEQAVRRRPQAVSEAVEHDQDAALPLLLAAGFDVDGAGRDRRTALHEAALAGRADLVDWLLAHGADPTRRDREFNGTPAGWASHGGHPELATRLEAAAEDRAGLGG